jgi:hypothetical protein
LFGLSLIVVSIVFFDNRRIPPFPNCFTLIPTCGATLIILFGDKNTMVGYLLSTRLLRWIGLISYSAYLWHQPLLAFIRLQSNQIPHISTIIILISVIIPLSAFSYDFVEQPFRNKNRFSQKQIFCFASLAFIITFILALFLIHTANNRSLIVNGKGDSYLADLYEHGNRKYVGQDFMALQKKSPTFSNKTSTMNRRIALVGDSFAQDFYNMIIEGKYLKKYEIRVYFIFTGCQIYLGSENRKKLIDAIFRQTCSNNAYDIKKALPIIRQANIIILADNWFKWSAERLPMTIKLLNLTKQQQIFILGAKHFGTVNPMVYVNKSTEYRIKQYQYPRKETVQVNNLLEKIIDKSIFINVLKMTCTGLNNTCPVFTRDGKLISYDGAHLTKHGARYVGSIIFKNKPFNKL